MRPMIALVASIVLACAASAPAPAAAEAAPKTVGIVVFDGFLTSEVTGPVEVFVKAAAKGSVPFRVVTIAATKTTVTSEEGLRIEPDADFASAPPLDVLLVPSALDMEPLLADAALVDFVRRRAAEAEWVGSNCAGAFLLGAAGLLDGRRVTTYIGGTDELRRRFPAARVVDDRHVVVDGNLVSSIGGVTSYDAALELLSRITDVALARTVAEALYYFAWSPTETEDEP